jgi:Polysaccharide lyase
LAAVPAAAESYCTGLGRAVHCFVDNISWNTEDGGGSWAITSPHPNDLRFEVRSGDIAPWDVAHNHKAERAEISRFKQKVPIDTDVWFSLGLMVEPGAPVTSRWLVLGQLHATEDPGGIAGSPPWAQELDAGDRFQIVVRTKAESLIRNNPRLIVVFTDPNFRRGRVYQFVYRLRYSQTHGLLQAWRDGQQIVDYSGPLGYINQQGPYFKFGIYRQPAPETIIVHYYDLHFGGPELKP